jgi:N-acetylmuramoyl-L-alanine amidase
MSQNSKEPSLISVLREQLAAGLLTIAVSLGWLGTSALAQQSSAPVRTIDARAAGNLERTRFVIDLEEAVEFAAFTLADPYRVVIDVPELDFSGLNENSRDGRGLVGTFRYGLIAKGKSRMVLDLTEPVNIDESFVLEPLEGQPARLVFDLIPASREEFLEGVGKLKSVGNLPTKAPLASVPTPKGPGKMVIVLDPGHGGIDDGAIGPGGAKEKDLVLQFALDVRDALNRNGGFDVLMTRDDDTFIALDERVEFARTNGAQLMVSIHADTVTQSYVSGATVYTLDETASDELSKALADKENRSDTIAGVELTDKPDDVADILIDLARRETKNLSISFARRLLGDIKPAMKLNKNPRRSADFRVLKAPDVPSVLVELGYLSNSGDAKLLGSAEWRSKVADRFAKSIESFFNRMSKKSG